MYAGFASRIYLALEENFWGGSLFDVSIYVSQFWMHHHFMFKSKTDHSSLNMMFVTFKYGFLVIL